MSCQKCGAPCHGDLCQQHAVEERFAHLRDDSGSRWASEDDDERGDDE